MSSASRLLIASPMPVPSIGPDSWPARWNGSKIRACLPIGMPIPSLASAIRTRAACARATRYVARAGGRPYLSERRIRREHQVQTRRSLEERAEIELDHASRSHRCSTRLIGATGTIGQRLPGSATRFRPPRPA
jgi:hypothetical protein